MIVEIGFDPTIARLGPLLLGWHGLFTTLAVAVALWLGLRRAARLGLSEASLTELATWGVVGGLIGARLFHVLDHLPTYAASPLSALAVWEGGMAVYGSFVGGILGGLLVARRLRLPVWPLLDAAAPAMLVGQAIGRLGCLSNGDAWGAPTGQAWGVVYSHPNAMLPPDLLGVPTHPYPLYEIGAVLLLLTALPLARRLATPGSTFLVLALGYGLVRLGLSVFRQESAVLWSLQEAQLVGLATALLAGGALAMRRPTLRGNEEPVRAGFGGGQ